MTEIDQELTHMLTQRGWSGRIVPLGRLADLAETIQGGHDRGLFDGTFYRELLSWFSFEPPQELPTARSMIIIAVPTPQMRVFFQWRGERRAVVVPPTYSSYTPRTERVREIVAAWLKPHGYHLAATKLPLKTLAVCSGLAEYGRNNICYVPGMGSFLQLVGAFSDLTCTEDPWREPKGLDRCESCLACRKNCPTGAIADDRFLLHAESCLTRHNEKTGEFADWIDPTWHHCLVGCMRCQAICPENQPVREWYEDSVEFSEPETAALVESVPRNQLPAKTVAKLEALAIMEDHQLLCRNLSALMRQTGSVIESAT